MRKILFLLTGIILTATLSHAQTKRALCIGIGQYQYQEWPVIHGDRDIEDLIVPMLRENGFGADNITILLNGNATSSRIREEMENLCLKSQPGDHILIYLSGHGQQVTDLDGDEAIINNDPTDKWDEAFVPYDAHMKNTDQTTWRNIKHITDDYIYDILSRIQSKIGKQGTIALINDACHSGDSFRGRQLNNGYIRGTTEKYRLPQDPGISRFPQNGKKEAPFVVIMSCGPLSSTREELLDGKHYGPMAIGIRQYHGETIDKLITAIMNSTNLNPRLGSEDSRKKTLF